MATKKTLKETEVDGNSVASEPVCTEAHVHTQQGQHVRSFTKDIHGDKFLEFALEFAKPRGFDVKAH